VEGNSEYTTDGTAHCRQKWKGEIGASTIGWWRKRAAERQDWEDGRDAGEEVKCAAVVALLSEAAVEQKESQISHAEIALKNAEEAAMMRDQPRQLQELAKAAAAFELASDERLAEVQQQMVTLRATK